MLDDLHYLKSYVSCGSSSSKEKARQLIKDMDESLLHHQKLIQITDRSDGGWKMALEYEHEKLADDDEDEHRIRAAENRAMKAKKKSNSPYNALLNYFYSDKITPNLNELLFCAIFRKNDREVPKKAQLLSYSRFRDQFQQILTVLQLDAKKYGTHSLPAGGETAEAVAGVPDHVWGRGEKDEIEQVAMAQE
uniref:Uncharacterized protein n=1 Tax=Romanomermis culicivorax TaxID=13658 RepID=A0A915LAE6_ROMCU